MAITEPWPDVPAVTRAGRQCPACKTVYSPDVTACHCTTVQPSLAQRIHYEPGGAPRSVTAPACTCPPCWGGLCPPPACPVHGQTEIYQVRC